MKIDLHCHSHFSDGKHSVEYLLRRAQENNISHLAITDHDYIHRQLHLAATPLTLRLINGVEISCAWGTHEIHVLGLCLNPADSQLHALISAQQQRRRQRMQSMSQQLTAQGHTGLWQYLESLPCVAYTRSHAADFLVLQGLSKSRQKAFKSYLGKKGRIYTAPDWCSMPAAVQAIANAGGIAVLAHPGRYSLSWRKLESILDDFQACGGEGMEVSYGNIQPDISKRLNELALSRQLYCSAGSDFHDAGATWTDLGKFPALRDLAKKNAIWEHPKWHSCN